MSIPHRKIFRYFLLGIALVGAIFIVSSTVHAQKMKAEGLSLSDPSQPDWDLAAQTSESLEANASGDGEGVLPPVYQDQCLHCHILGEETRLWTPFLRWAVFGTVAVVFVFAVYQNASVWKSRRPWEPIATRVSTWIDERYQTQEFLSTFLKKPVPIWATRWWYCLGGITAFLFVVQGVTGIMLAFYYKPTPEEAYASIQFIESQVLFGASIRAIHHWSANGMVVMCFAHLLRVFIMGAFKPPRELNWSSGVVLLVFTLLFGLTGYLLPWDQRAYWASTVATEIAGAFPHIGELVLVLLRVGWNVTGETLSRFYALHILVLPVMIIAVMALHFIMVRRQGVTRPL